MGKNKKVIIIVSAILVAVFAVIATLLVVDYNRIKIHTVDTITTIELGEVCKADMFIEEVKGPKEIVSIGFMQGESKVAEYEFSTVGPQTVVIYAEDVRGKIATKDFALINVEDTTKPEVTLKEVQYFEKNKSIKFEDLVEDVYDYADIKTQTIRENSSDVSEVKYSEWGTYALEVVAIDINGNETVVPVEVLIDAPPVFARVYDIEMPVNGEVDFLEGVVCVDFQDDDIVEKVYVDEGSFDPATEGEYEIGYVAVDEKGIEAKTTVKCTVGNKNSKYKKNNIGEFNESSRNIYVPFLIEKDYFRYDAISGDDYDKTISVVEKTNVAIEARKGGRVTCWGFGNIYKVTPDYIYITTVEHVIKVSEKELYLTFYNGEGVMTSSENFITESTKGDRAEVALFRIKTSDIPTDILVELKQANVDFESYNKNTPNMKAVNVCRYWHAGLDEKGSDKIYKLNITNFGFNPTGDPIWRGRETDYIVSDKQQPRGTSGSAVFALNGDVLGFSSCVFKGETYYIPVWVLKRLEDRISELKCKRLIT